MFVSATIVKKVQATVLFGTEFQLNSSSETETETRI